MYNYEENKYFNLVKRIFSFKIYLKDKNKGDIIYEEKNINSVISICNC